MKLSSEKLTVQGKLQRGFTFIEAIVALVILGIALAAIVPAFTSYSKINTDSQARGEAVAVAQQVLDRLRKREFTEWPSQGASETISSGTQLYQAVVSWCTEGTTNCSTTPSARQVKVEVKRNDKVIYTVETVYTDFD